MHRFPSKHTNLSIHKQQTGVVLITGLVFLLIISMACITTLQNMGMFFQAHADEIAQQKQRYLFEAQLSYVQNLIMAQTFQLDEIDHFIQHHKIWHPEFQSELEVPEQLYLHEEAFINENGFEKCVELVGEIKSTDLTTWVIRITLIRPNMPQYAFQLWLAVIPAQPNVAFQIHELARYEYRSDAS